FPKMPAMLHIVSHNDRIVPRRSPTCAHSHSLARLAVVHQPQPRATRAAALLHHSPESTNHSCQYTQTPAPHPCDRSQSPATPPPTPPAPRVPNRHNAKAHTTHPRPHTHAANPANL